MEAEAAEATASDGVPMGIHGSAEHTRREQITDNRIRSGKLRLPADKTTLFRVASPSPLGPPCGFGLGVDRKDGTPHSPSLRPPYPWAAPLDATRL